MTPVALTIAGSDPSGGAGLQADLKTFHRFGVYGEAVVTLVTVQNTVRVSRVEVLAPDLVAEQIEAVLEDIPPAAAKTGALGSAEVVRAVARAAARFTFPLVVDPVMVSKHGLPLLPPDAAEAVRRELLPHAALVTPNLPEAEALTGLAVDSDEGMKEAARRLLGLGPRAALVKGGHREGAATDLLFDGENFFWLPSERIDTPHTHGTGCTLSAAITASLAAGLPLVDSVRRAKAFIESAIRTNPGLGRGCGPVNHHAAILDTMTKVQIRFRLERPLDDAMLARIAEAHAIYGIFRIAADPAIGALTVEYDATRLRPAEVHAALAGAGIPIAAA